MKKILPLLTVILIMFATAQNGNAQVNHSRSQMFLLATDTFWSWDDTTQTYALEYSYNTYTYDSLNRQTGIVNESLTNNVWEKGFRDLYTYGGFNTPVYTLTESWNDTTQSYDTDNLYTDTYDANNNNLSHLVQGYASGAFVNQTQDINTYDSHNYMTSKLVQSWNGAWVTTEQDTFINTFDNNNDLTQQLRQTYVNGAWQDSIENVCTYDGSHNQLTNTYEIWGGGSNWIVLSKDSFTYDGNNNQTNEIVQQVVANVLTNSVWYLKGYDSNNNKTSQVYRSYVNGVWVNQDSSHLYYNEVTAGIQNIADAASDISIYPNPSRSVINVVYNSTDAQPLWVNVFDMMGRKLLTQLINDRLSQVNVSDLSAGMYQVVFTGTDGTKVVKHLAIE